LFVCFFRCQNCPTILVENELALSQLPSSVSYLVYLSIYGGILTLVLIPLLSLGHSICTVNSDDLVSIQTNVGTNWLAFVAGTFKIENIELSLKYFSLSSFPCINCRSL